MMTINEFAELNVRRCYSPEAKAKWGDTEKRDLTDWALCIAGEAGELCNTVKKHEMYVHGGSGNAQAIVDEACDVLTYVVLLLKYMGVSDIENALMAKFDEVSERINWKDK